MQDPPVLEPGRHVGYKIPLAVHFEFFLALLTPPPRGIYPNLEILMPPNLTPRVNRAVYSQPGCALVGGDSAPNGSTNEVGGRGRRVTRRRMTAGRVPNPYSPKH